jgi:AcrR family transcriptional regulator
MSDELHLLNPEKKERADAVRNRRLLLDTAGQLFRSEGAENVTMSLIAERAQVGKGTLYRHFPDKAQLIMALLDSDMTDLQHRVFAYLGMPLSAKDKLRWFLEQAATFVHDHNALLRESSEMNPRNMLRHPAHLWWRQTIRGLLMQCHCDNLDYTADVLYLMLDVQAIHFQIQVQHYTLGRIVEGLHFALAKLTS